MPLHGAGRVLREQLTQGDDGPADHVRVGRMRARGVITRGTTFTNRLRRLDRWLSLPPIGSPLVVDLGYGAYPTTTVEWHRHLRRRCRHVRLVGLEIDPGRVAAAQSFAVPGTLEFRSGGFELAGLRPGLVRAMNVLRQYDESDVASAWRMLAKNLASGGRFVDGTSDELGRVAAWVVHDSIAPVTLTLATDLSTMDDPAVLAERLPKALIHRNVPGEAVHSLLTSLRETWARTAVYSTFGPRDRWRRSLEALRDAGWPVLETPNRRRDGTITVPWRSVAPSP